MRDCRELVVRLGDAYVESRSFPVCQTPRRGGQVGRFRMYRRGQKTCYRVRKRGAFALFSSADGRRADFSEARSPYSPRYDPCRPGSENRSMFRKIFATKSRIIEVFSRRAAEDPCDGSLGRRNKSPRDDRTLQGSRHRPPKPLSGAFGLQSPLSAVLQAGSRGRPSRTVPIPFVIDCRTCVGKGG